MCQNYPLKNLSCQGSPQQDVKRIIHPHFPSDIHHTTFTVRSPWAYLLLNMHMYVVVGQTVTLPIVALFIVHTVRPMFTYDVIVTKLTYKVHFALYTIKSK